MLKKILKRVIKSALLLTTIAGTVAVSAILFETYLYDYKGNSVVKITKTTAARSGGTGFAITAPSGKRYTLTNAHICRMGNELVAHTQDGRMQSIKVVEIYDQHDLCIMEPVDGLRSLNIASKLSLHERVWLIGHPALRPLTLESGHFAGLMTIGVYTNCSEQEIEEALKKIEANDDVSFEDLEQLMMLMLGYCVKTNEAQYINNIAYGGNSGSPVVNIWGNVIGVLYAGRNDQPTASFTVPLKDIQKFLENK